MSWSGPAVYRFPDRLSKERVYPVLDESGSTVATIAKRWAANSFDAWDAMGHPLCSGRLQILGSWVAEDAAHNGIASVGRGFFGVHRVVLCGGTVVVRLRSGWSRGTWRVEDGSGRVLVSSVAHEAGFFVARDAWLVASVLTLAETIAVTELYRLAVKRRRRSGGGSASGAG